MISLPTLFRVVLAGGLAAALAGCGSDKAQGVSPQDFYARPKLAGSPISPLDRPGILATPNAQAPVVTPAPHENNDDSLSEFIQEGLQTPSTRPATTEPDVTIESATTHPSTTLPALAADQYMTLGGVVQIVNGRPIYANKVLRLDAPILRNYAKQMNIDDFEDAARGQIEKTIGELRDNELEIALYERSLDPKDIQLAKILTSQWSKHQIEEAGGSEEVARLRAHESGEEYEDQEENKYYYFLQALYYDRKINPQILVSPEDERKYYKSHISEFTTPSQATIILIEANPARLNGDRKAAMARLQNIRQRALAGEDFAAYGRQQNDLPGAAGSQGNGGQIIAKPNTMVLSNVEAQVWKTPPGQISDVIEDHDAFFIFKVLSREDGGTKSFADRVVQDAIKTHLSDLQRQEIRHAELRRLNEEDIAPTDSHMIDTAVEMALQNYPKWKKE